VFPFAPMTFSPPSMAGAPRVLPGRANDLRKIALFPSLSRCLRFGEPWPLAPYSGAPASYARRRSWRAPRETIPAHEMRCIGLAIFPASSRCSRISKPCEFPVTGNGGAAVSYPNSGVLLPFPFPCLISAAHFKSYSHEHTIPLYGSFS
jgi:hypothetical protein